MLRFIVRRLLFITAVSIFIIYIANLGMVMTVNSDLPEPSYDLIEYSRQAWQATTTFISDAAQGDLGTVETDYGTLDLGDYLRESYINSAGLLLVSLTIAAVIGLAIGSWAALTKYQAISLSFLTITIIGISVPSFFAAILLQQFAIRYQQQTGSRFASMAGFAWDVDHMLLPVLVLTARPLAYLTRAAFIGLGRVINEEYIRTAYSKGLGCGRVIGTHAMRNTAVPILTAVTVSLRFSLSTLPIVESFFGWPGLGARLLQAINDRNSLIVVTFALALGLTFLLINLILDVSYRYIDPRLRQEDAV